MRPAQPWPRGYLTVESAAGRHLAAHALLTLGDRRRAFPLNGRLIDGTAIDQLRTIDKVRLAKRLGVVDADEAASVLEVLKEFFAP